MKILIVDDHLLIREALKIYLSKSKKYEVVAEAENGRKAFEYLSDHSFDLILTDINMPVSGGIELIEDIRINFPNQLIATISMEYNETTIRKLRSLGVRGFFFKNVTQKDFVNGLDQIFNGDLVYPYEISEMLKKIDLEKQTNSTNVTDELTDLEKEMMKLLVAHKSANEVAALLNVSIEKYNSMLNNLHLRAGCKSNPGLVLYVIEKELI